MSKSTEKKMKLKVILKHPHKRFRLGRHIITHKPAEYSLNEKELKELQSKGCQKWLVDCNAKKAPAKKED